MLFSVLFTFYHFMTIISNLFYVDKDIIMQESTYILHFAHKNEATSKKIILDSRSVLTDNSIVYL